MVTNPSYTGMTYFGKTSKEGKKLINISKDKWTPLPDITPAIINQELFDRTQLVLKDSKILHRGRPQHEYLLTGHIKCGYCNSPAVGSCQTEDDDTDFDAR
jgi:site-specific DNA recombinase